MYLDIKNISATTTVGIPNPTVYFTLNWYQETTEFFQKVKGEIEGLSPINIIDGKMILDEFIIYYQEVTSASAKINQAKSARMMSDLSKRGLLKSCAFVHSHADMGVFFSGVDDGTIAKLSTEKYLISVVGNKKGEFKCRIDIPVNYPAIPFSGLPKTITLHDCPMELYVPRSEVLTSKVKAELEEKVTQFVPTFPVYKGNYDYSRFTSLYGDDDYSACFPHMAPVAAAAATPSIAVKKRKKVKIDE
jgi:hypothetical protein